MKKFIFSYLIFLAFALPGMLSAAPAVTGTAEWITHPDVLLQEYAVILFRNKFELINQPDSLYLNVSADNHYRLIVNGQYIKRGPARADLSGWYYDTINIAPYLNTGTNLIAAEVINWGSDRSPSILSKSTAFYLEAEEQQGQLLNTGQGKWYAFHNIAHHPVEVDWLNDRSTIDFGYYAGNPTDSIRGDLYPWGWESIGYDDSQWVPAVPENHVERKGKGFTSGTAFAEKRELMHRQVPELVEEAVPFGRIRSTIGLAEGQSYIDEKGAWVIPANEHVTLLIDQGYLTMGFPEMIVSDGKSSSIRAMYAENLIIDHKSPKGNRNDIDGKYMVGIKDLFMPDGGEERHFRPTGPRTFRYIQIDITTSDQPLIIENYYHVALDNTLELKANFQTDHGFVDWAMEAGWRTVSMCARDILFSDAYYEQLQYASDSRVHSRTLLSLSGDDRNTRSTLLQFDQSRIPNGLTRASYPHNERLVMPSQALDWVNMVYDYMLWRDDKEFIDQFEPGIQNVLHWYNQNIEPTDISEGIAKKVKQSTGSELNVSYPSEMGNTWHALYYAYTLKNAAEVFSFLRKRTQARRYRYEAWRICRTINRNLRNADGFYIDAADSGIINPHTQIMAVLAGAATRGDAVRLMEWVTDENGYEPVDLLMYSYLFEAMEITGHQNRFFDELTPWMNMQEEGLSTFTDLSPTATEQNQRAECRPASSSLIYFFFRTICGIKPVNPGHQTVEIAPEPQQFKTIVASYPHYLGNIDMKLRFEESGVEGEIDVPEGMKTTFIWNGKKHKLKSGLQNIAF